MTFVERVLFYLVILVPIIALVLSMIFNSHMEWMFFLSVAIAVFLKFSVNLVIALFLRFTDHKKSRSVTSGSM